MMSKILKVLLCLGVYMFTSNAAKAPFIKPCKMEDSDCLIKSGQAALPLIAAGLPDLGVPSADPMLIDEVKSQEGGLDLVFKDMKVEGLKMCKLVKLEKLADKFGFHIVLECPIMATGKYIAGGKLLFVPVEGNDAFEIKTANIRPIIDLELQTEDGSDGEKRWKVVKYTASYETVERFYFDMKNLFNGDETKAKPILDILNHSWKEVITTVGKPIIDELIGKAVQIVEKFFDAVPANELQ